MGERQRFQRLGDEETGRCGCGRRGEDGKGVCIACDSDLNMAVSNPDRVNGAVLDVTEQYKKDHP